VVVLASTDPQTGPPPPGWPEAAIGASWTGVRATCAAEAANVSGVGGVTCETCGLCYNRERLEKTGGVVFIPHGTPAARAKIAPRGRRRRGRNAAKGKEKGKK